MPGELITIENGRKVGYCELFQLAAMEAKGWRRCAVSPTGQQVQELVVEPKACLFPIYKDGSLAWCDQKSLPAMEKAGWVTGDNEVALEGSGGSGGDSGEDDAPEVCTDGLSDILAGLDPYDDELWTHRGLVKLAELNERFGLDATRADIDETWPNFDREVLLGQDTEGA